MADSVSANKQGYSLLPKPHSFLSLRSHHDITTPHTGGRVTIRLCCWNTQQHIRHVTVQKIVRAKNGIRAECYIYMGTDKSRYTVLLRLYNGADTAASSGLACSVHQCEGNESEYSRTRQTARWGSNWFQNFLTGIPILFKIKHCIFKSFTFHLPSKCVWYEKLSKHTCQKSVSTQHHTKWFYTLSQIIGAEFSSFPVKTTLAT